MFKNHISDAQEKITPLTVKYLLVILFVFVFKFSLTTYMCMCVCVCVCVCMYGMWILVAILNCTKSSVQKYTIISYILCMTQIMEAL